MGPMALIHKHFAFPPFQKAVEIIYAPLIALYGANLEPISSLLKWYIDLCRSI